MIALRYYPSVNGIPQFIVRLRTTYSFLNVAFKAANGPPQSGASETLNAESPSLKRSTHRHRVLGVRLLCTPTANSPAGPQFTVYLPGQSQALTKGRLSSSCACVFVHVCLVRGRIRSPNKCPDHKAPVCNCSSECLSKVKPEAELIIDWMNFNFTHLVLESLIPQCCLLHFNQVLIRVIWGLETHWPLY